MLRETMIPQRVFFLIILISIFVTAILSQCSNSYLIGAPLFLYTVFPYGSLFLILALYLYVSLIIFSLLMVKKNPKRYLLQGFIIAIFLLLNILASKMTKLDVDFSPLFRNQESEQSRQWK